MTDTIFRASHIQHTDSELWLLVLPEGYGVLHHVHCEEYNDLFLPNNWSTYFCLKNLYDSSAHP